MNASPDHNIIDAVLTTSDAGGLSDEALIASLSAYIHHLVNNDFERLVSLLYRIDVNEDKLRSLLAGNTGTDSGRLIAEAIIERQLQKLKSRQQFRANASHENEQESW